MGTMTKIAITSAIGLSIVASTAMAAAPADMQKRVDTRFTQITTRLNTTDDQMTCRTMAVELAKAGARGAKQKGAELNRSLTEAITTTSEKNNFEECLTVVYAGNAASAVSGVSTSTAGVLGKAPVLGGLGAAAAASGVSVGAIAAGALALGGIAAVANSDNDKNETPASPAGDES